jgi:hypothetical protein
MADEIYFIPAGYRLCTHGVKVSQEPVDWSQDVITLRFTEESHLLAPDDLCMVPMERSPDG